MNIPLISVVIPVYNAQDYLKESIESVLQQTFVDFELIIVDDGSTDGSVSIIEQFSDTRICLIKNRHDFIQSLNKGMSASKGKYIARMDADDIMLPKRLQNQYVFMENNPQIDICGGWATTFGLSEYTIETPIKHNKIESTFLFYNSLIHPTIMIKKEILECFPIQNNIYQLYHEGYSGAEDYYLWTELIIKGYLFENIPNVLIKHRLSVTQVTSAKQMYVYKLAIKIQIKYLEDIINRIGTNDNEYYNLLDNAIELYKENKLKLSNLKQITQEILENIADAHPSTSSKIG